MASKDAQEPKTEHCPMTPLDWMVFTLPIFICAGIALYTRRYVRSVADFMAGGRHAGRYLLSTSRGEQGTGAVVFVATLQIFFASGFTLNWWSQFSAIVISLVAISGFVLYRYRQTRALTLAQFFEVRYSRRFRLFAGVLGFLAGIVNFGLTPAIGARFIVYFCELPQHVQIFHLAIPTYQVLMAIFLSICVLMTTAGGQITVLIADCAGGMFSQLFFVIISVSLLVGFFHFHAAKAALLDAAPGQSLVNPFDSSSNRNFNLSFSMMGLFMFVYSTMGWQNSHAFNASGATPHEVRMGSILGRWRMFALQVMLVVLGVCGLMYLKSPEGSAMVRQAGAGISNKNDANQMKIALVLLHITPVGIRGALASACLMGMIAGDGIHLHSWGSILIQDVVLPLRRRHMSTKHHLMLLRLAIVGVAVWAFIFGSIFPQTEYIQIWWAVTQAIFCAGAGACIIGGLYWSRGTVSAAWVSMILGAVLTLVGMGLRIYYQIWVGHEFPLNGQEIAFYVCVISMLTYIFISYFTCRTPFDMDRLLHRGKYAVESDETPPAAKRKPASVSWRYRIMGIDEDFTFTDRLTTMGIFGWGLLLLIAFVIGSTIYFFRPWSASMWIKYWYITWLTIPLLFGVFTTIWFTIGGFQDMAVFFRRLREEKINPNDDGMVRESTVPAVSASAGCPPQESKLLSLEFPKHEEPSSNLV